MNDSSIKEKSNQSVKFIDWQCILKILIKKTKIQINSKIKNIITSI